MYKDFGITADEETNYASGRLFLNYFLGAQSDPGVSILERHLPEHSSYSRLHLGLFSLLNPNNYYEWYHLFNTILAFSIFVALYIAFYNKYKNAWLALLPVGLLFLTPRFVGHVPANPKDIPFAVFFMISFCLILLFKDLNTFPKVFLTGAFWGYSMGLRLLGITLLIPLIISVGFYSKESVKSRVTACLFAALVAFLVLYLSMPVLHRQPIIGLWELFTTSSAFPYWDREILFMGKFITKDLRPWWYLPVWFLITTPAVLLVSAIYPFLEFKRFIKNRYFVLTLITLVINLLLYFIFNPVIYNGLRHFLFLLPLLVIISSTVLITLIKRQGVISKVVLGLLTVSAVCLIVNMLKLHPYEYVFFNVLSGGLKNNISLYESDYWGATYKEGTEWLREHFSNMSQLPKVYPCEMSSAVWYYAQGTFEIASTIGEANYVLCDYETSLQENIPGDVIHTVSRLNAPLLYIKKL